MKRSFFSILAILLILSGCPEPGDEGLGPESNTQPGTDDGTTQPEANTIVYHNIDNVFNNPNPEEYAAADLPVELSDVSAGDGLTFAGWYDNAAFEGEPLAAVAEGSAGRIDLYAKWEFRLIGSNGNQYTAAGGGINGAEVEGANGIVYRLTQTGIDTYTAAAVGFSEALTGEVRLLDYFTFNYDTEIPVTEIGESAFEDCEAITRADLSGNTNLKRIGSRAFYDCDEMTTVSLSGCTALVEIGEDAFSGFRGLEKLTTFDLTGCTALRLIGNSAFDQNAALTAIDLTPCTALETIGDYAFRLCKNVTSVDFGESVKSVGESAFADTPMSQIEFDGGSSLEFIGADAFSNTGLTEFDFADCPELFEIGSGAFYRTNLTQITLRTDAGPDHYALATIGNRAFNDCEKLTKIDLQYLDNLTTIGDYAFEGCDELSRVSLGADSISIGKGAFNNTGLEMLRVGADTSVSGNPGLLVVHCDNSTVSMEVTGDNLIITGTGFASASYSETKNGQAQTINFYRGGLAAVFLGDASEVYVTLNSGSSNTQCLIVLDTQIGIELENMLVDSGDKLSSLPSPSKDGYIFKGWESNGNAVTSESTASTSMVLTANWQKENSADNTHVIVIAMFAIAIVATIALLVINNRR